MATTSTSLYRAIVNGTFEGELIVDGVPVDGVLYPRFVATTYTDRRGVEQTSNADVTAVVGAEEPSIEPGGGTSLFDVEGWFGHSNWRYFKIPEGTEIPETLKLKRGNSVRTNPRGLRGRHWQIEAKARITVVAMKGALDNFARAAVVRQVEMASS